MLFFCAGLSASPGAEGKGRESSVRLNVQVHHYLYREYDDSGDKLNQEKGNLPGLDLVYRSGNADWKWRLGWQIMSKDIDYQGKTNLGNRFTTLTDERIDSFYAEAEWTLLPSLSAIAALKRVEWDRQIRARGAILGLNEVYNWHQVELGVEYQVFSRGAWQWLIEGRVIRIVRPTVKIDLTRSRLGSPRLIMQDKNGYSAGLAMRYQASPTVHLTSRLNCRYWSFGASDLTEVGDRIIPVRIQEPKSRSALTSSSVGIDYLF
ncbi:MAG: hypothetical protein CSB48_10870 [Proteobacteria bacterium]|nr:MAG: hypothetical protein CSB48_10870 [Pseudomonadota bacterium]PIE40045.1 MAG: hypothetical protein CSA51_02635 [Gammaproteobacteria bacterium]